MPNTRQTRPGSPGGMKRGRSGQNAKLIPLSSLRAPQPNVETLRLDARVSRLLHVVGVRRGYKDNWPWGAAAEYLYRALIRALGLQDDETELLRLAKRKPGRKEERELSERILRLRAEGKTVPQMKAIFEAEGQHFSIEKIESYLKTRRKGKATLPHW